MINTKSQYKNDLFTKLEFDFKQGLSLLDVGCGDGSDSEIFIKEFGLKVKSCDVYEHKDIKGLKLDFKIGSILDLPYKDNTFDYVFLHDVLHHIDEENQSREKHVAGLREINRVLKKSGTIVIVEGNRYNPLFYPHMVKLRGHEHFKQSYFKSIINEVFDIVEFKYFEAHVYPKNLLKVFKVYEWIMEHFMPKSMLSYNVAIIRKRK